jgi:lipoate-protein ligase B
MLDRNSDILNYVYLIDPNGEHITLDEVPRSSPEDLEDDVFYFVLDGISLEDAMIDTAAIYGLSCQGRVPGKTGVWLHGNKIGAVGVAISGGVSYHGISFNASPDLSAFRDIVACGDTMSKTTSLEQELKPQKINLNTVATQLSENIITRLRHEGEQVQIGDIFDEIDRYV